MAVIDSNNFITHLVWSGLVDKATCGELKEAIELCTVKDIYTKDDMVAILDKIRAEIIKYEGDCRLSVDEYPSCKQCTDNVFDTIYAIHDKYKAEIEPQKSGDKE